jgi:hypothetical protein
MGKAKKKLIEFIENIPESAPLPEYLGTFRPPPLQLYGLKQAPRLWYQEINEFLLSIGFTQSTTDPNLYIQPEVALLLYVDDIIIAHTNAGSRSMQGSPAGLKVKEHLKERFKMIDLGRVRRFLGIEVDENYNISQKEYIQAMLRRFGTHMSVCTTRRAKIEQPTRSSTSQSWAH